MKSLVAKYVFINVKAYRFAGQMKSILQLPHEIVINLRQMLFKNKVDTAKNEGYNLLVEI